MKGLYFACLLSFYYLYLFYSVEGIYGDLDSEGVLFYISLLFGYKTDDVFFNNPISVSLDFLSDIKFTEESLSVVEFLNKDAAAAAVADKFFAGYLPNYFNYLA